LTAMQLTLRSHSTARVGVLGIVVAAGAFGLAAMMSAVTAPTARADDFTEILSAVEGDFTESYLSMAATDLAGGDFAGAAYDSTIGSDTLFVATWEALIMGAAGSLGF
jgi:hypothetical protein